MSSSERDIAKFLSELHARLDSVTKLESELTAERVRLTERAEALERDYIKKRDAKVKELEQKTQDLAEQFEQQKRGRRSNRLRKGPSSENPQNRLCARLRRPSANFWKEFRTKSSWSVRWGRSRSSRSKKERGCGCGGFANRRV